MENMKNDGTGGITGEITPAREDGDALLSVADNPDAASPLKKDKKEKKDMDAAAILKREKKETETAAILKTGLKNKQDAKTGAKQTAKKDLKKKPKKTDLERIGMADNLNNNLNKLEKNPERLPVLLSIKAEQDFDGLNPENTELLTEGVMETRPDGLALRYQESALTGMEGTVTEFEIRGARVILRRTGSVTSQMVFEEGRQHTSLYETPFGELSIDVQTSYLRHDLSETGGFMDIRYSISVEHAATGKNRFRVSVKRKNHAET